MNKNISKIFYDPERFQWDDFGMFVRFVNVLRHMRIVDTHEWRDLRTDFIKVISKYERSDDTSRHED